MNAPRLTHRMSCEQFLGLALEVGIGGLGVRVGPEESYQPEAVVFPRELIQPTDRYAPEPIIVVEVLSPSTRNKGLSPPGLVMDVEAMLARSRPAP